MRRLNIVLACVSVFGLFLGGCGLMDYAVGPSPEEPGPATKILAETSNTGGLIGLFSSLLLGGINIYQVVRAKQKAKAASTIYAGFESLVRGIDNALLAGEKSGVTKAELYDALGRAVLALGVDAPIIRDLVAKIKADNRSE